MYVDKPKFIEDIWNGKFGGNNNQCAKALGVEAPQLHKFVNTEKAQAGPLLLGGLAVYCRQEGLEFWDFIILPKVSTANDEQRTKKGA